MNYGETIGNVVVAGITGKVAMTAMGNKPRKRRKTTKKRKRRR